VEPRVPPVDIRLLGPIELRLDGRDVSIGGPRQRALLALLALRPGQVVGVDDLIEQLWAGEPTEGAETTLRSYVSRLRQAFEARVAIERTDRGYRMDVAAAAVDVSEFERLVREAVGALDRHAARRAREGLAAALALWRGRPFGEVASDGTLGSTADRLEELHLLAIERRIEADLELGLNAELVDEIEGLLAAHPFRENLWQHLMLALYRSDRQADALAAFQRARLALDEQLGIEPGRALQALETAILQQSVPSPASGDDREPLSAPITSFVGRAAELAVLEPRLRTDRLVTLTGVGGVGKTRLALELAQRLGPTFDNGVAFVDLSLLGDPSLVAGAVANAMGVREKGDQLVLDLLAASVRTTEMLLVLDNCEHVRETAATLVDRLLRAGPRVRVLATSRAPLGVPGEIEVPVAPLDVASDAVSLLLARASAARPSIGADPQTIATAVRICTDLEGLPLAIELAAARARSLSLEDIAQRLDDRFKFLVSWRRVTTARHRTLREAMDWSHELLRPEEQALLASLSVFSGGFGLPAVVAVCAGGDEDAALQGIEVLVEASLVIAVDGIEGETRYRLLETVREYAAQRLAEAAVEAGRADRASLRLAHAAWFLELAETAAPQLSGEHQGSWFARLEMEQGNLRAAFAALADAGRWDSHLRLAISLTRFWYVRGHLREGRAYLERALVGDPAQDPVLRRRALTAAASLALLQGDYATATSIAEEALEVARHTGEQRLVANALSNLGAIVLAGGDVDRAGPLLEDAVGTAREAGDERILALAVNNLGDYSLTRGAFERAGPLFEESLTLLRARGDTANVARALFNLGASELELGRHAVADGHFREGLALARDAGDREDLAWILEGLAAIAAARGRTERAALLLGAADAQLSAMGADHKPYERSLRDRTEGALTQLPGEPPVAETVQRGAELPLADAIELALADEGEP
jgi:predicted ATPase/DNA-binding SARP family transcriptional activator